ncbi:MAG: DUF177 domain-containing protein [Bacilli bacterium]|nr:DUF177 domain-containing protein [Bacilli bacterium]
MQIDLNKLNINGTININELLTIDEELYKNTSIKELKPIKVDGKIFYNVSDEIELDLDVEGIMVLEDSITLDPIDYPYSININEIISESNEDIKEYYQNSKNILDIMPILWQNIVLEVPISITKEKDAHLSGEGWELNNEEENKIDPRLAELSKLLDEGKE